MIDITGVSDVDTNVLEAGLSGLGINKYKGKQIDDLVKYYKMVVSANSSFNLTAITEWNDFVTRHFIDSLALVRTGINLNNDLKIIDIGTGAGFPGIPLKIMYPELQVTLLDSLKKRVSFLEEVVDSLKLEVVSCFHGRAEDYGRDEKFRERYSLCVSRAVAKYLILLEYSLPFLEVGGCFIGYKSGEYEQEVSEAKKPAEILGGGEIAVQKIVLPGSDIERTFVMTGKIGETPEKYPRRSAKIKRGVFS